MSVWRLRNQTQNTQYNDICVCFLLAQTLTNKQREAKAVQTKRERKHRRCRKKLPKSGHHAVKRNVIVRGSERWARDVLENMESHPKSVFRQRESQERARQSFMTL